MTDTPRDKILGKFKDTYKGNTTLLGTIQRHVMRSQDSGDDRDQTVLHPSDMCKDSWCVRRGYYQLEIPEAAVKEKYGFRLNSVFAWGHDAHTKWQRWAAELDYLWGKWECPKCDHHWLGAISPCSNCGYATPVYQELALRNTDLNISGHTDGLLLLDDETVMLWELKTVGLGTLRFEAPRLWDAYQAGMKPDAVWFRVNRPFPSHLRQGNLYLYLAQHTAEISDEIKELLEYILFIYEWKVDQDAKEFKAKANMDIIGHLLDDAATIGDSRWSGVPPDRPSWAEHPSASHCASCSFRDTCWDIKKGSKQRGTKETGTETPRVNKSTAAKRRKQLAK